MTAQELAEPLAAYNACGSIRPTGFDDLTECRCPEGDINEIAAAWRDVAWDEGERYSEAIRGARAMRDKLPHNWRVLACASPGERLYGIPSPHLLTWFAR